MGSEFLRVPDGWTVKPLIDCTTDGVISYGIVQPGSHDANGIPVLRVNNFNNSTLDVSNVLKVSPEIESKFSRTRLKGGEVLLTLVGSTGQSVVAPPTLAGWNVPRAIAVIRPEESIGSEWINICLQNEATKGFLDSRANTTVQKTLNLQDVKQIPILLPPAEIKDFIERIATQLSGKIQLNRQINTTLESMAQALFKSWFVDFDPVIDNALAAGNPIPDELSARAERRRSLRENPANPHQPLPVDIQQLFPSSFVFTEEMGWVPEGWEPVKLSDLANFKNGKTSPERDRGETPVYGSNGIIGVCNEANRENVIVIGRVGTYCGSLYLCLSSCWVTDNAMSGEMKNKEHNVFLFELLKTASLNDRSSGSGQPLLNQGILNSIQTVRPSDEVISNFSKSVTMYYKSTGIKENTNASLAHLRDSLIPKLLSGQLQIPDAEQQLAEVI